MPVTERAGDDATVWKDLIAPFKTTSDTEDDAFIVNTDDDEFGSSSDAVSSTATSPFALNFDQEIEDTKRLCQT